VLISESLSTGETLYPFTINNIYNLKIMKYCKKNYCHACINEKFGSINLVNYENLGA
jgi:hypothetical protein